MCFSACWGLRNPGFHIRIYIWHPIGRVEHCETQRFSSWEPFRRAWGVLKGIGSALGRLGRAGRPKSRPRRVLEAAAGSRRPAAGSWRLAAGSDSVRITFSITFSMSYFVKVDETNCFIVFCYLSIGITFSARPYVFDYVIIFIQKPCVFLVFCDL